MKRNFKKFITSLTAFRVVSLTMSFLCVLTLFIHSETYKAIFTTGLILYVFFILLNIVFSKDSCDK